MNDYEAREQQRILEAQDEHGDLAPPWAKYPDYTRYTIGWRMGSGESWMMMWGTWLRSLPDDRPTRLAYLKRHGPAPRTWASTVAGVLDPSFRGYAVEDRHLNALIVEGLVQDDVAYPNWVSLLESDGPIPPWRWHEAPELSARYAPRTLTFWARWCVAQRTSGGLLSWLEGTAAPEPWLNIRMLLEAATPKTARPPIGMPQSPDPAHGYLRLATELASRGTTIAPWRLVDLDSYQDDHELETAGYADAWRIWATSVFDDAPTWEAYVKQWGGVPNDWQAWLESAVWFGPSP